MTVKNFFKNIPNVGVINKIQRQFGPVSERERSESTASSEPLNT